MPEPRVEWRDCAYTDLEDATDYIRRDSPTTALRFLEAARATVERLLQHPGPGRQFESDNPLLSGLRCFRISGFGNYLVFYRPTAEGIEVVRILHGARDLSRVD